MAPGPVPFGPGRAARARRPGVSFVPLNAVAVRAATVTVTVYRSGFCSSSEARGGAGAGAPHPHWHGHKLAHAIVFIGFIFCFSKFGGGLLGPFLLERPGSPKPARPKL